MAVYRLTDRDDPRVALFRDVRDPELVRQHGLFAAEGRLVVRRLLESRRFRTRAVLTTEAALEALADAIDGRRGQDDGHDVDVFVASPDDLATIGGFNFHRGCLALGERPRSSTLDDLDDLAPDSLARDGGGPSLILALEAIANADNVGGLFRNAAAFGARAVLVDTQTCDPLYRKATRTSMGATLTIPFAIADDWPAAIDRLRTAGHAIVALTPARDAIDLDEAAVTLKGQRLVLIVGSEGTGLRDETIARADHRVSIAMAPGVDSLNVATASGVALHRLARIAAT